MGSGCCKCCCTSSDDDSTSTKDEGLRASLLDKSDREEHCIQSSDQLEDQIQNSSADTVKDEAKADPSDKATADKTATAGDTADDNEIEGLRTKIEELQRDLEAERKQKKEAQDTAAVTTPSKEASAELLQLRAEVKQLRTDMLKQVAESRPLPRDRFQPSISLSFEPGVDLDMDPALLAQATRGLKGGLASRRESQLLDEVGALKKSLRTMRTRHSQIKEEHAAELKEVHDQEPEYLQQLYIDKVHFEQELARVKKQRTAMKHSYKQSVDELTKKNDELAAAGSSKKDEVKRIALERQITQLQAKVDKINRLKQDAEDESAEITKSKDGVIERLKKEVAELKKKSAAKPGAAADTTKKTRGALGLFAAAASSGAPKMKKKTSTVAGDSGGSTDPRAALNALMASKGAAKKKPVTMKKASVVLGDLMKKHKASIVGGSPAPAAKKRASASASPSKFAKYDKMKKVGLPPAAIRNKMKSDGISADEIATYFGEKPAKKKGGAKVDLSKYDLKKYDRMKKVGLPPAAVRNKMKADGIDAKVVGAYFGDPVEEGGDEDDEDEEEMKAPNGSAPDMKKYERMKKVGLPPPSIKNKMKQDGIHVYYQCKFFGEPLPKVAKASGPPCPKPDFSKYERMKKVSLPPPAIRNKMKQDKIDPYWVAFFFGDPLPTAGGKKKKAKKKPARKVKPLHWRKKSDCDWSTTIWSKMDSSKPPDAYFEKEMQDLMQSSFAIVDKKKAKAAKGKDAKKEPAEITLLDGKRSFNITVGLSRVGMSDVEMRDALLSMDEARVDADMIQKISKYVPTDEELKLMRSFKGDATKLARAEKLFMCLSCMSDIPLRLQLWEFKMTFLPSESELQERIHMVHNALTTVRSSQQLTKFMEVCLAVGNWMNEGTRRGAAKGFRMDTFDRFTSMKTTDNKLSMMEFIIRYIRTGSIKDTFEGFPQNLEKIMEPAYRIDSKAIRDAVADMEEALQRIGKRIKRANRGLSEMQTQFNSRAGGVFRVFGKLRKAVHSRSASGSVSVLKRLRKYRAEQEKAKRRAHKRTLLEGGALLEAPEMTRATTTMFEGKKKRVSREITDEETMEVFTTRKRTQTLRGEGPNDALKIEEKKEDESVEAAMPKDRFELVMTGFHTRSELRVQNMKSQYEGLKKLTESVALFFGEADDLEWEALFKLFKKFFELFAKAEKKLAEIAKRELKEKKRKEREAKRATMKKKRKPVAAKGETEPVNILEEIRMRKAKGVLSPKKITAEATAAADTAPVVITGVTLVAQTSALVGSLDEHFDRKALSGPKAK